jgi:3-hydroxybutyryl-CoA dehydrogenase
MPIRTIAVIGSGTMGRGIAYLAALAGYDTIVFDAEPASTDAARGWIESSLRKGVEAGKLAQHVADAALPRVHVESELEAAAHGADLIIEAIPEDAAMKRELFAQVDLFCSEETIIASNTSSLSITELASNVERRDRFVGLHFFNPPHLMKLIEIVRGERTSDETVAAMRELAASMQRVPIVVRDTPGFATTRLGMTICIEAMRMLEDDVASAEDIDQAMVLGYNHPMGPLRLSDHVGLDVCLHVADYLASTLGARFSPPAILRRLVAEGKLGHKTGHGFYSWGDR